MKADLSLRANGLARRGNVPGTWSSVRFVTVVGPEFSSQLIMLKESFRQVIICLHEPGYEPEERHLERLNLWPA